MPSKSVQFLRSVLQYELERDYLTKTDNKDTNWCMLFCAIKSISINLEIKSLPRNYQETQAKVNSVHKTPAPVNESQVFRAKAFLIKEYTFL